MDNFTAIHIIESLANGIDPFTDNELPQDSTIQNVEAVRALFFALSAIKSFVDEKQSVESPIGLSRSEQEYLWIEYCQLTKFEDPYQSREKSEEGEEGVYEHELEEDYDTTDYYDKDYDKDYEVLMNDLREELFEDAENYARSEEEGWFYQNEEGSWEENLSNEE